MLERLFRHRENENKNIEIELSNNERWLLFLDNEKSKFIRIISSALEFELGFLQETAFKMTIIGFAKVYAAALFNELKKEKYMPLFYKIVKASNNDELIKAKIELQDELFKAFPIKNPFFETIPIQVIGFVVDDIIKDEEIKELILNLNEGIAIKRA